MDIISQNDARAQGLTHFYTGVPCAQGHDAKRYVSIGQCVACVLARQTERRALVPAKQRGRPVKIQAAQPTRQHAFPFCAVGRAGTDRIEKHRAEAAEVAKSLGGAPPRMSTTALHMLHGDKTAGERSKYLDNRLAEEAEKIRTNFKPVFIEEDDDQEEPRSFHALP